MGEREDYADLDWRPWRVPRAFVKWLLRAGIVCMLVGIAVLIYYFTGGARGTPHYDAYVSVHRAELLAIECRMYYRQNPDKRYPATLADLRRPPAGIDLLTIRDDDLVDAWGKPFQYALFRNPAGELEPYVWTEWTRDGKTSRLGVMQTANGIPVRFGLPKK